LSESPASTVQIVPHPTEPAGQMHFPAVHVAASGHTVPHAPQLFASFVVSTHTPAHAERPDGHPHLPSLHA
jgi:hypothetical protein